MADMNSPRSSATSLTSEPMQDIDVTLEKALEHARTWIAAGLSIDDPKLLAAFYDIVRLNTHPTSGFTRAAERTFSSPFWVSSLSSAPADPSAIAHLTQCNKICGQKISGAFAGFKSDERHYLDLGVGAGNTMLAVLEACNDHDVFPNRIYGCDVSSALLRLANERVRREFFSKNAPDDSCLILKAQSLTDFVATLPDRSLAGVSFNYALHHLGNTESLMAAIRNEQIRFDGKERGFYYQPRFGAQIAVPDVELPNFVTVLRGYFPGQEGTILRRAMVNNKVLKLDDLGDLGIVDQQVECLSRLRKKMRKDGIVVLGDPNKGDSKFNRYHLGRALDSTNEYATESAREIGVACFSDGRKAAMRFSEAGFKIDDLFYQVRCKGKDKLFVFRPPTHQDVPIIGQTVILGEIEDVLGYGVVARAAE